MGLFKKIVKAAVATTVLGPVGLAASAASSITGKDNAISKATDALSYSLPGMSPDARDMSGIKRNSALSGYSEYANTKLATITSNPLDYGMNNPTSLDREGKGGSDFIYENGKLLVKNESIDAFYSIFAGEKKSANAQKNLFLPQDTVLSGASASKKGTVLGGVI